jgi:hypothetical protein
MAIYCERGTVRSFATFFRLMEMAPHAEFRQVPTELALLQGDVDLGFENLGLPPQQQHALRIAFEGDGLAVPGTTYKLSHLPNSTFGFVEAAT